MALALLERTVIEVDRETDRHAWSATLQLSRRHHLTPYDAAYLELALRRQSALATTDRALRNAAVEHDLELAG